MKRFIALLVFVLIVSCDFMPVTPDQRFTGEWKYDYDYPDDARYTIEKLIFDNSNKVKSEYFHNDYYFISEPDYYEFYYLWSIEGNNIRLESCDIYGVKNQYIDDKVYNFKFIGNSLFLDEREYIKQ